MRGYVDRLDITPAGDIRVVDYKTGATPREAFEAKALFQMKFYALVLWRTRGVVPRQLRLIYLADTDTLTYAPDAEELERFERTLKAIWAAIERATQTADFRPSPSRLCEWCDHQVRCPAFGGTPPPFPSDALAAAQDDRRRAEERAPCLNCDDVRRLALALPEVERGDQLRQPRVEGRAASCSSGSARCATRDLELNSATPRRTA